MKFLKDYWLVIVAVILFGGNLTQYLNPVIKIRDVIKRDTVTTVIIDSVSLTRVKAELEYLRSELKNAEGKIVYKDKVSEIEIRDTTYIVPNFIASLDTTFNESSIKLKYHYPENEFRDIRFSYPIVNSTIKETKTVEVTKLFTFNHGIQVGFGYGVINKNLDLYVGYGFQLSW